MQPTSADPNGPLMPWENILPPHLQNLDLDSLQLAVESMREIGNKYSAPDHMLPDHMHQMMELDEEEYNRKVLAWARACISSDSSFAMLAYMTTWRVPHPNILVLALYHREQKTRSERRKSEKLAILNDSPVARGRSAPQEDKRTEIHSPFKMGDIVIVDAPKREEHEHVGTVCGFASNGTVVNFYPWDHEATFGHSYLKPDPFIAKQERNRSRVQNEQGIREQLIRATISRTNATIAAIAGCLVIFAASIFNIPLLFLVGVCVVFTSAMFDFSIRRENHRRITRQIRDAKANRDH